MLRVFITYCELTNMYIRIIKPNSNAYYMNMTDIIEYRRRYLNTNPSEKTLILYIPRNMFNVVSALNEELKFRWGIRVYIPDAQDAIGKCSITGVSGPVKGAINDIVSNIGEFDVAPMDENENLLKDGLKIEIFDGIPGEYKFHSTVNISELISRQLLNVVTEIRPRVTAGGFDADNLPIELSIYHPAIVHLYMSSAGTIYRNHCSSIEKNYMIEKFEKKSAELEKLKNMSCVECNSIRCGSVYKTLQDAVLAKNNLLYSRL